MAEETGSKVLYLIDGTSNIFRAFYAIRGLTNASGHPTNASFGFTQMLRKLLEEHEPEFIGVAFDRSEPTLRHQNYPSYKATRQVPPEDLVGQIPDIKEVCRVLGVPQVELAGYEADDLMGTLARKAVKGGFQVVLVSSDKDLLQLVGDSVRVLHPSRAELLDREGVKGSFGVYPEQVIEVLALMGDTSDNVPGVPGIGEKGAKSLIVAYGSIEECIRRASEISRKTYRESLLQHAGQARMSRDLVTIHADAPVEWNPERFRRGEILTEAARTLFRRLEFQRLLDEWIGSPAAEAASLTGAPEAAPLVVQISDAEHWKRIREDLLRGKRLAIVPVASSPQPMTARLKGLAVGTSETVIYYADLETRGGLPPAASEGDVWILDPDLWESSELPKLADDMKFLEVYLLRHGRRLRGADLDSSLAAYLLNPGSRDYRLERLGGYLLGETAGGVASPVDDSSRACIDCGRLLKLEHPLKERLRKDGLESLYRNLELPLTSILAAMEFTGVRIDTRFLSELSARWNAELEQIESRIHGMAGETFNIQSPRQLGRVLFEKLGLSPGRKTDKDKVFSTGVDVLETLAGSHPLPAAVLDYRSLSKLLSTYVESLPSLVNPLTGRVHASFNQTTAATGRLSSSDPNLQNIPIRTERGREIRKAFVAQEGWTIITADYSQIELRVLAHLSGDEEMLESFRSGEDIHQRTAAEVFSVRLDQVTPRMRYQAKAINFGILYGMGAFRLSKELDVPLASAKQFIEGYFERFPRVKRYQEQIIESALHTGRVSTLLGRIRLVPEIHSRNMNQRNQGIRIAVNTTVQGTAADLIKTAMVNLDKRLKEARLATRLLIQVHDELVLEAPASEVEQASTLVQDAMENCFVLSVPLVAEVRSGRTWLDTK